MALITPKAQKQRQTGVKRADKVLAFISSTGKENEENFPTKKKRHSPDPNKINFDRDGLLSEIRNLPDGSQVTPVTTLRELIFAWIKFRDFTNFLTFREN